MPDSKLVKTLNHEEEELQRKKEELAALEDRLAELELDLSSLHADVDSFLSRVNTALGGKLLEQANLRSRIAEALLLLEPENREYQKEAEDAQEDVREAQQEYETSRGNPYSSAEAETAKQRRNSEEVRSLYLRLVRLTHPDLTTDPGEKEKRTEFMKRVNAAYAVGDRQKLEELYKEWGSSPESVQGEGIAVELVRVIRQIAQVNHRIEAINVEITDFKESDDYQLFLDATDQGFDEYLMGLMKTLDSEIAQAKKDLEELLVRIDDKANLS